MKEIAVLGLGRFGASLAQALVRLGNEVLGLDIDEKRVNQAEGELTHVVIADMTDRGSLEALGIANLDAAAVCTADLQTSIMATMILKEIGVKKVICKAANELHERILKRLGADQVIFPERDMGARLAYSIAVPDVIESMGISPEYSLAEIAVPREWVGRTLMEADVRAKYGLNVVAIRRQGSILAAPGGRQELATEDVLIVIGKNEDLVALDQNRQKR